MFNVSTYAGKREEDYPLVLEQARHLFDDSLPLYSNLANLSALLSGYLDRCNWVGFYLWDKEKSELILGPFQGKVACTRIPLGRGVCGTAIAQKTTQLVANVHDFPGHIACDSASLSEIVVPLMDEGAILGVLDIDSPELGRFDQVDQLWLEKFCTQLAPVWAKSFPYHGEIRN